MTTKTKPRRASARSKREKVLEDRVLDAVKQYEKGREAFGRAIEMLYACRAAVAQAAQAQPAPPVRQGATERQQIASLTSDLRTLCIRLDRLEAK